MGEIKRLTPEDYVLQYACTWSITREALRESPPHDRPKREADHRLSERNLLQSVDIYMKKNRFES